MSRLSVALEITPPLERRPAVLLRRAALLNPVAQLINVIQRPARQPSLDACLDLLAAGRRPVWHLVTHGRERSAVVADLERAAAAGVQQLLCVRGDHTAPPAERPLAVLAAVRLARCILPAARIGVAFNQYAPDRRAALRSLVRKLEAGADCVQTQPVLQAADAAFLTELRVAAPGVPLWPMVMPLLSTGEAQTLAARVGLTPPASLLDQLANGGAGAGWCSFRETAGALAATPGVAGLTVMTRELDPRPEVSARLRSVLAPVLYAR